MKDPSALISLWSQKSHYRQTRKGKILQSTSELYLRDDLGLGFTIPSQISSKRNNVSVTITGSAKKISDAEELLALLVPSYSKNERKQKTRLVVIDTNVLLHNIDVLEHPSFAISNIAIPQTALLECRHRSFTTYERVMDLLRSSSGDANSQVDSDNGTNAQSKRRCVVFFPDVHHVSTQYQCSNSSSSGKKSSINDENDARIRQVASYYGEALSGGDVEVILLSDDKGCRELAIAEQKEMLSEEEGSEDDTIKLLYTPKSVREHVTNLEKDDPDLSLSDLVAQFSTTSSGGTTKGGKKIFYKAHLPQNELSVGAKAGKYYQGTIRAERGSHDKCYVTVRKGEDRVAVSIIGTNDINRAVDGDVVVIELNSIDKWIGSEEVATETVTKKQNVGIAEDTAEPSIRDESNVTDVIGVPTSSSADKSTSLKRPTGRVVGIIRRNFRKNYCGSIHSVTSRKLQNKGIEEPSKRDMIAKEHEKEHPDGTITCAFFAVDARVPPVLVRTTQRERLIGKRILIAIDSWPSDSKFPLGHYVKTIGDTGVKDVETEVLLHEHNIPCEPFPAKVCRSFNLYMYHFDFKKSYTFCTNYLYL